MLLMTTDRTTQPPTDLDLIGKILSPALRFWLRSQVEDLKALELSIQGKNRQILRGYIPKIKLQSQNAVYQGLHLSFADLTAANVRINMGKILSGHPLNLLEPVPIAGQVQITQRDLQASLAAPLLQTALQAAVRPLIAEVLGTEGLTPTWQQIEFGTGSLKLSGQTRSRPIVLTGELRLLNPRTLSLSPLQLQWQEQRYPLDALTLDLGEQVEFSAVAIAPDHLTLIGKITVIPV